MDSMFPLDFAEKFPQGKYKALPGAAGGLVAIQLTSAQLLALQTTAVQLVPAPSIGPGYQLYPTALYSEYVFNSVAYTIGNADNAFQIEYTGKAVALLSQTVTGLVDQSVSTCCVTQVTLAGAKIAKTNCNGLGLEVKLAGTTPALTLGNGVVNIVLGYDIVTLF